MLRSLTCTAQSGNRVTLRDSAPQIGNTDRCTLHMYLVYQYNHLDWYKTDSGVGEKFDVVSATELYKVADNTYGHYRYDQKATRILMLLNM